MVVGPEAVGSAMIEVTAALVVVLGLRCFQGRGPSGRLAGGQVRGLDDGLGCRVGCELGSGLG